MPRRLHAYGGSGIGRAKILWGLLWVLSVKVATFSVTIGSTVRESLNPLKGLSVAVRIVTVLLSSNGRK